MLGSVVGGILPIGGAIGGALVSGIGNALGGLADILGHALAAPFMIIEPALKVFDGLAHHLAGFGQMSRQAAALGISGSQFQGLGVVFKRAGIEGDQVNFMLASMAKNVAAVAGGWGKGAARGFEKLGLDAEKLMAMPIDQQFLSIADAIARIPPGAEQAAVAMQVFKGAGANLLPLLEKGGAGIQAFIEQQKRFGAVLSDSQLKSALDAAKAWKTAKMTASSPLQDSLVNRITILSAPLVEWAGTAVRLGGTLRKAGPVFDWMGTAVNRANLEISKAVFDEVGKRVMKIIDGIGGIGSLIPGLERSQAKATSTSR